MNTFIQDEGLLALVLHWHIVTVQRIIDSSGCKMLDHELQLCFGCRCWSLFCFPHSYCSLYLYPWSLCFY